MIRLCLEELIRVIYQGFVASGYWLYRIIRRSVIRHVVRSDPVLHADESLLSFLIVRFGKTRHAIQGVSRRRE